MICLAIEQSDSNWEAERPSDIEKSIKKLKLKKWLNLCLKIHSYNNKPNYQSGTFYKPITVSLVGQKEFHDVMVSFLFVTFHCYESLRFDWCHYLFCKSYHTNEREMNGYSKLDNLKLIRMLTKVCKVFAQQFIEIMENENIFCWTENNKQSITKCFFPILTDLLCFFCFIFQMSSNIE